VKNITQTIKAVVIGRVGLNNQPSYRVATTVNLLEPLAGSFVTKEDLQSLIEAGVKVTVVEGRR